MPKIDFDEINQLSQELASKSQKAKASLDTYCKTITNFQEDSNENDSSALLGGAWDSARTYMSMYQTVADAMSYISSDLQTSLDGYKNGFLSEVGEAENKLDTDDMVDLMREMQRITALEQAIKNDLAGAFKGTSIARWANKDNVKHKMDILMKYQDFEQAHAEDFATFNQLIADVEKGLAYLGDSKNFASGKDGFSLANVTGQAWYRSLNKYNDKHSKSDKEYRKNLKEQYGFDDETIEIIMKAKRNLKERYPNLTQRQRDYILNRLLGGLVYGDNSWLDNFKWANTAGTGIMDSDHNSLSIADQLKKLLGLSDKEYNLLKYKVRIQNQISSSGDSFSWDKIKGSENYKDYKESMEKALGKKLTDKEFKELWEKQYNSMVNKTDFAHQSITTATNLYDGWRLADILGGHENTNNLAGWKGDATIKGENGLVSFGKDDYKADLDAENIAYLMKKYNISFEEASNRYYSEVGKDYSRAELFLKHTKLSDVKKEIFEEVGVNSMEELKKKQPDAWRFIKNLEHKTNELGDF